MSNSLNKKIFLSRREFIKVAAASALSVNVVGCQKKARKSNLLFIWTDEQRADTMAAYGNQKIKKKKN